MKFLSRALRRFGAGQAPSPPTPSTTRPLLTFLYLLYCVEVGVFLLLAPWSRLWSNSYFVQMPALRLLLLSGYVRGGVSAIGLWHLVAAARDFLAFRRMLNDA